MICELKFLLLVALQNHLPFGLQGSQNNFQAKAVFEFLFFPKKTGGWVSV